MSWFMKCIKERLARRANRADGCTGHFWEGRFQSVPLLDQAAVIAAMAYVDLNPIRAAMADRPETSDYTSAQDRCRARQAHRGPRPRALSRCGGLSRNHEPDRSAVATFRAAAAKAWAAATASTAGTSPRRPMHKAAS
jgi:hypothetical protein